MHGSFCILRFLCFCRAMRGGRNCRKSLEGALERVAFAHELSLACDTLLHAKANVCVCVCMM